MNDHESIDPEALTAMVAEMTVWASHGLIVDDFHRDIGAPAVLTVAPPLICTLSVAAVGAASL